MLHSTTGNYTQMHTCRNASQLKWPPTCHHGISISLPPFFGLSRWLLQVGPTRVLPLGRLSISDDHQMAGRSRTAWRIMNGWDPSQWKTNTKSIVTIQIMVYRGDSESNGGTNSDHEKTHIYNVGSIFEINPELCKVNRGWFMQSWISKVRSLVIFHLKLPGLDVSLTISGRLMVYQSTQPWHNRVVNPIKQLDHWLQASLPLSSTLRFTINQMIGGINFGSVPKTSQETTCFSSFLVLDTPTWLQRRSWTNTNLLRFTSFRLHTFPVPTCHRVDWYRCRWPFPLPTPGHHGGSRCWVLFQHRHGSTGITMNLWMIRGCSLRLVH